VTDEVSSTAFADLAKAELVLGCVYRGGSAGNHGDDPIARLIPGSGNQGGFRAVRAKQTGGPGQTSRPRPVRLVILYTTGKDPDWPDSLDERTGIFTYYGDNKTPGAELHDTPRKGNLLLADVFARCYGSPEDRRQAPPFLLFTKARSGRDVRFGGLLAPGCASSKLADDLQVFQRTKDGDLYQNYVARFTVLDVPTVTRAWIDEVLAGDAEGPNSPAAWREWLQGRVYRPRTV
jgi:hypothetical protein